MAAIGAVGEFDSSMEDWESYIERVEFYMTANGITDEAKKRATLFSICGVKTYHTIRNLAAPTAPGAIAYDDILALAQGHFCPKPDVTVQRYKFNSRVRGKEESVAKFVEELRHIALYCEYKDSLNDMLRDRLICGINHKRMQCRLLAEKKTTFEDALKLALAMEAADKDAKDLTNDLEPQPVQNLRSKYRPSTKQGPKEREGPQRNCYRCGGKHSPDSCYFKEAECHACHKKGHIARVCKTNPDYYRKRGQPKLKEKDSAKQTNNIEEDEEKSDDVYNMFTVKKDHRNPIVVDVIVQNEKLKMEVDTGAAVSLISEAVYRKTWKNGKAPPLQPTKTKLKTYTGEEVPVLGTIQVEVTLGSQSKVLSLVIVKGEGPSLLGRDWLMLLKLDWQAIHSMVRADLADRLSVILDNHSSLFKEGLGTIQGETAKLHTNPQVHPKFCKPRPVPFSLREKVEVELERLEKEGIIRKRQFSEWAAPIVPVLKDDGTVRVCGDYKVTANQAVIVDPHPIPRIEDIFAKMAGGTLYTKLDLSHAYLQLRLDDAAREYLVINTHRGLYEYTRLPFGVSSAPAIFQRTMESILQGLDQVAVYIDDILITGRSEEEHLKVLDEVLQRLEKAGMRLKKSKCTFLSQSVEYLGHKISKEGLQPTEDKVRAITHAPKPNNVSQLKAFLGLVNYYHKFMPNLSTVLSPLYKLLQVKVPWTWGRQQQQAFDEAKSFLKSPQLLTPYDTEKPLVLACDASPVGVGAVLAHRMEDGSDRPIGYASRALTLTERKYAQIDKEALAIVYGIKRFHQYLYGRNFIIHTDHKPLMYLFNENRSIPATASARVQRWALTISGYTYQIQHRSGTKLGNADGLSRLPLPTTIKEVPVPTETVLLMEHLDASLVTAAHIKSWTDRDIILAKVKRYTLHGWPDNTEDNLKQYKNRKDELSVENGCLLWGARVIVPPQLQKQVLEEIHQGHPGIVRMKAFARCYVWWPSLNADIEKKVQNCTACQQQRKLPPSIPIQPWEWPQKPWTRVHIDYAGPFMGKMLLVAVDSYSKWIDVFVVSSTSTEATLDSLRKLFANNGLPEVIVSDNGTSFTSVQFKEFVTRNGIKHITTAPYHPSSNGLAERAVQTVKDGLKKMTGPLQTRVSRFLFNYRTTPHTTTGATPAELLMGRRLRTHLDLVYPSKEQHYRRQQEKQVENKGQSKKKPKSFLVGERVMAKNFGTGTTCRWLPGKITRLEGNTMVEIELDDKRIWRRHIDHIIRTTVSRSDDEYDPSVMPWNVESHDSDNDNPPNDEVDPTDNDELPRAATPEQIDTGQVGGAQETRHSTRTRPPINRYAPTSK